MDLRISKIVEFIDKNIEKGITLKKAAYMAELSPGHLSALFKKETGARLGKYLKEKRIERARFLLTNSDLEIKNIVLSVGYKNIQNFYHDFKNAAGTTPRAYREKARS